MSPHILLRGEAKASGIAPEYMVARNGIQLTQYAILRLNPLFGDHG